MSNFESGMSDAIHANYEKFVELLEQVKNADEKSETSDGRKGPTRLEVFTKENSSKSDDTLLNNVMEEMLFLAQERPDSFAVTLHSLRELLKNEIKVMADAVLPDVLSSVAQNVTEEDSEELAAIRSEAAELRETLKKQLDAADTLGIPLNIPKKDRQVKGGNTIKVYDLPFVPGARKNGDSETSVGRPTQDSHMVYFIDNVVVPAGTSLDKVLILCSTSEHVIDRVTFDLATRAEYGEGFSRSKEYEITFKNGVTLKAKPLSK